MREEGPIIQPHRRPILSRGRTLFLAGFLLLTLAPAAGAVEIPRDRLAIFSDESDDVVGIIVKLSAREDQAEAPRPSAKTLNAWRVASGKEFRDHRRMSGGADLVRLSKPVSQAEADQIAAIIASDPDVVYAVPDRRVRAMATPNDPLYSAQWHYHAPAGGSIGANLPGGWDLTTGDPSLVVAVIDTGILPHADLAGRTVAGYDMIFDPEVANDGDGRDADPSDPGDPCDGDTSSWHGTHVAGTVGAVTDNGLGVTGVNWNSKIQPVRVLGVCGGYLSDVMDGMRWAAGLPVPGAPINSTPAKVLNLSLGGVGKCSVAEQSAVDDAIGAGAVVVVAAGNESALASKSTPASCTGVITVAATNRAGGKAWYTNTGSVVAISAPGGDMTTLAANGILSTLDGGATTPNNDDVYAYYQGTSMATPHVAGIASLLQSVGSLKTPAEIRMLLEETALPFPSVLPPNVSCTKSLCGAGIVDAAAAVTLASVVNTAPTAEAGPNQSVLQGASVTLAGSGTDNSAVASYAWSQISGMPVTLSGANTDTAQFTAPNSAGSLRFQLKVTDDQGWTAKDSTAVTVNPSNFTPQITPIATQTANEGETVSVSVIATDADGTTPILSAANLPEGSSFNSTTGAFTWTNAGPAGSYSATFKATDSEDSTLQDTETVTITIKAVIQKADQGVSSGGDNGGGCGWVRGTGSGPGGSAGLLGSLLLPWIWAMLRRVHLTIGQPAGGGLQPIE